MAVRVAHDNVAVPIDHDSGGAVELSGDAFTVAMSLPTVARQCGHQALGVAELGDSALAILAAH
eukprot:949210-Prorocentrum_minimum.AAC.4